MIISLNWLKKFVDIDISVDKLVDLISTRLVEIESVTDIGKKYEKILLVKVIESKRLEGSDHLSVIKIDDGGVSTDIDRDQNGLIQVVCGALNIATGQIVVWLPPKSIVPQTFGDPEPFELGTRNLRGVVSNGMIASAKELDLFDDQTGILVIDEEVAPGSLFSKIYELDDFLLDIENKTLTHRPDCFGIIGFAREVAAIIGKQFTSPDWVLNLTPYFGQGDGKISVVIDNPELSDRYQAIVLTEGDCKKKSPMITQTYLARVGVRPISSVVDITNYLMMLTGQPLHAFDFDKMAKVAGDTYEYDIHVRAGRENEKLELLDGRTISLTSEDIVIAAGDTAVGLAGAMGGLSTVIDDNTRAIIIESATFNLYKLRATQMRHGIFSEAITRFTKGQPAELTSPVLAESVRLAKEWSGFSPVTTVAEAYPGKKDKQIINVPLEKINEILGINIGIKDAIQPIACTEFKVKIEDPLVLVVEVPYWRSDIHILEDIVEEVGRINGFDNINPTLPKRDFTAVYPDKFDIFRTKLRKKLVRAGANEVLTYSFTHGDILKKVGQKSEDSYRLVNSISPELQYFRQTITPSLLALVHPNIKKGFDNFSLFETNKSHYKPNGLTDENVPVETDRLALVLANKNIKNGSAYYQTKKILNYIFESFDLDLVYKIIDNQDNNPILSPFEYKRSAEIVDKDSGLLIGYIGEYKKSVIKDFKLPAYVAGFEINIRSLFESIKSDKRIYIPLSRYPSTERDICFKVKLSVLCGDIIDKVNESFKKLKLQTNVEVLDIYKPEGSDYKNITIRINLVSNDHTLTGEEINAVISSIVEDVKLSTNATVL
ncbi:MAG: phenylalanine--tRNA ligase subunit beta [Candidatus Saccharibacteria bacterium]